MSNATAINPARLSIQAGNAQHIGRRDSQQDAWGFSNLGDEAFARHAGYLAVLADGMGGLQNGVWASSHGVSAYIDAYRTKAPDEDIASAMHRAMIHANRVVHTEASRLGLEDRMGTTLVAAVVHGRKLHWISVGDSRVYLCANGRLVRLSTDHNFSDVLAERVRRGEISLHEAQTHPMRNGLTSYLGRYELVAVDTPTAPLELVPGSWILLCSDGLSGVLGEDEIMRELRGAPQEAAKRLIDAVLQRAMPHQDNVTVVVLQVPDDGALSMGHTAGQTASRMRYKRLSSAGAGKSTFMTRRNLPVWIGAGALGMAIVLALAWRLLPMQSHLPERAGMTEVPIQAGAPTGTPVGEPEKTRHDPVYAVRHEDPKPTSAPAPAPGKPAPSIPHATLKPDDKVKGKVPVTGVSKAGAQTSTAPSIAPPSAEILPKHPVVSAPANEPRTTVTPPVDPIQDTKPSADTPAASKSSAPVLDKTNPEPIPKAETADRI